MQCVNQGISRLPSIAVPLGRVSQQLADNLDLVQEKRSPGDLAVEAQYRRVQRIEGAIAHRLVDFTQMTRDLRRHHQYPPRLFTHYSPRSLYPPCAPPH